MTKNCKMSCKDYDDLIDPNQMLAIRELVKKFPLDRYKEKTVKNLRLTRNVINEFKKDLYKKVTRYDIFRELKVEFNENLISDVIASLFNPKKSPFGKDLILNMLKFYHHKKKNVEIYNIIKNTNIENISCHREVTGESSRIDIRITTHNELQPNAIIDIELKGKNRYAGETFINGIYQTVREYDDLLKEKIANSERYCGNTCDISAFYITPHGESPNCKDFERVSYDDLREIVDRAIENVQDKSHQTLSQLLVIRSLFNSSWVF